MIGAIIGTGVGITGAYMRESFLEPHQRASDAAKRAVGAALALGFGGGIGIWMALYFVLELTVSSGELVLGIIAFAPGFAVIPMSIIVILIGFFIDQTNDTWAVSKDTSQPARANPLADPPPSLSALGSDQNTDSDLVSVKNWGGLKLAVRAAWLIFAGATLLSGLGWVLMSVMFG